MLGIVHFPVNNIPADANPLGSAQACSAPTHIFQKGQIIGSTDR